VLNSEDIDGDGQLKSVLSKVERHFLRFYIFFLKKQKHVLSEFWKNTEWYSGELRQRWARKQLAAERSVNRNFIHTYM